MAFSRRTVAVASNGTETYSMVGLISWWPSQSLTANRSIPLPFKETQKTKGLESVEKKFAKRHLFSNFGGILEVDLGVPASQYCAIRGKRTLDVEGRG